jgi:CBS domain-containing protein
MERVGERTKVGAVMHRGAVTCDAQTSGFAVARIMAAHRIHSVVVTAGGGPPRVVTDAEVAAALSTGGLAGCTAAGLARAAPLLTPSDSLALALELMRESGLRHAVVVGPSFRVLGVISVLDAVESVLSGLP